VKISALIIGFAGFAATCAIAPARAEDLTAGKTPAQLFRSDCGACHRSPNGLVKERGNASGLAAFLRDHYTTNSGSAAALAAYVSGLASSGGSTRSRGERHRSDGDTPVTATAVPADPNPAVDPPARRRHNAGQPDDAGRRRARDDGDAPRPPREVSHRSSGLDSESASSQAARTGAPKARKRRGGTDETAASPPEATRTNAEAPPAADAEPKPAASAPAETSPQGEPQ
jgi:hypothetical protein